MSDFKTTISWLVTMPSSTSVNVTIAGVTEPLTTPTGDYHGIQFNGTDLETGAESVAQAFCDMIATHSEVLVCEASYDYTPSTGNANPATVYTLTTSNPMVVGDKLVWGSLDPSIFGFKTSLQLDLYDTFTTDRNSEGYWCPLTADNVYDLRNLQVIGSQSFAASANTEAAFSTRSTTTVINGSLVYDVVDDAYIRAYRATEAYGAL